YEPPPGPAPGYHTDHHWTVSGMMKIDSASPQSLKSGTSASVLAGSCSTSPLSPPTCGWASAKYATENAPTIAIPNWIRSTYITPRSPPLAAKTMLSTAQMISV